MSTKIGGRTVTPALPIVDGTVPSSPSEIRFNNHLTAYIASSIQLETSHEIQKRERALDKISTLCLEWIECVAIRVMGRTFEAGGGLFTSGSYRLGVHEPGADIDTIVVAPNMCTREDFFGRSAVISEEDPDLVVARDPESLAERIRRHGDVTNFNAVEGAAVPILTFDWEGVNIDLLFARINRASVPADFDIDDDAVLDGVDPATEKSLNGPRVTNLIAALVGGTDERYQSFLSVVRCVRKWAKARGLYSNKMGYWGGVNINIAVALVIQLYPNSPPGSLLRKFFLVFKSWRWPNPVMLTKPHNANLGLPVWNAYNVGNSRQVAPVITPAYPSMNSTLSVSRQTLQILQEEIGRGHDIIDKLWKEAKTNRSKNTQVNFDQLFEPSDFFISYPFYLCLCIVAPTLEDLQGWSGFVESRLRKLVSDMLGRALPLSKIQLWPKKFEACCVDKSALLSGAQRRNCVSYFIGFQVDRFRMRGNQLNIEQQIQNFKEYELTRFHPLVPGMDVLVRSYKVKELPSLVFHNMYPSKEDAMKKRRRTRDADPKRQEAKRIAKLKELKAKMAEKQRKIQEKEALKSEQAAEENKDKDKEKDPLVETPTDTQPTPITEDQPDQENEIEDNDDIAQDEADLLENALDSIQIHDANKKTREEAEQDRIKLLAGELLTEGGDEQSDDEELEMKRPPPNDQDDVVEENVPTVTVAEREAQVLKRAGYNLVSDDEVITLGLLPPERVHDMQTEPKRPKIQPPGRSSVKISFTTKFDVVELDANGNVVDKGDEDFAPSKKWTGRKPGFEFKLGLRGLGFYRSGKKVLVPSLARYNE